MVTLENINKIFDLYARFGDKNYIGEEITQIEHMIQCAMLSEQNGESVEVILGCLFHDIGHLIEHAEQMGDVGVKHHEKVGAQFIRDMGFPELIGVIIENHVQAKRYLCSQTKDYILSDASAKTLIVQGGKMTQKEALQFEQHPYFDVCIRVRHYDEQSKIVGFDIHDLEYYRQMCLRYVE